MAGRICIGSTNSFSPEANRSFEKAVEAKLNNKNNSTETNNGVPATPIDIPDGSTICANEDGSIHTYNYWFPDIGRTVFISRNFIGENNNINPKSEEAEIRQTIINNKKEEITYSVQTNSADILVEPDNLKGAWELIKAQAEKEKVFRTVVNSLFLFL